LLKELEEILHKTITVTGLIIDINMDDTFILEGSYVKHDRYGFQFQFQTYEKKIPEGKDAVIEFLSSSLIKGCGLKTAEQIVETLGLGFDPGALGFWNTVVAAGGF